ncbi:hypothetical protein BDQ17DRAFT_1358409 [Cyathus striatus]|nr:hypothetical protein BDQ17DRAFT_1358409 [Cyathus striatus]
MIVPTLSDSNMQPSMKPSMDPTQPSVLAYAVAESSYTSQHIVRLSYPPQPSVPDAVAESSYTSQHVSRLSNPTVYHYNNPRTGEYIASLLPPDNPTVICLQAGTHVPETKYGVLGILAAICWFPLGIVICLLDRRVKCTRCGLIIDEGLCH